MPKSISLGEHFERFIADQVAQGRYDNESDVVRAGLRLLEKYELELGELRAKLEVGDRAYAEGRFTVVDDVDEFVEGVVARSRARSSAKAKRG